MVNIIEGYADPYLPDKWVVLDCGGYYRLLAGFKATNATRDSYRINDRIVQVRDTDGEDRLVFISNTNTKYICRQEQYGLNLASERAYKLYFSDMLIMDEDTDWFSLDFA